MGVGYVSGSTIKDGRFFADPTGSSTLLWRLGELAAGESVTLKYHVTVNGNAPRGLMTNTVTVTGTDRRGARLSDSDTADISLSGDITERKGRIRGSVFVDINENGIKNANETGLGGVSIVMENGERMTTEEDGSFVFEEVKPGEHLVALDERRLPDDYFLIGDSSVIVSVFWGGTARVEFSLGYVPPPPPPPTTEEILALRRAEEEAMAAMEEENEEEEESSPPGVVKGRVFIDSNWNTMLNPGEAGVPEIALRLDGGRRVVTDAMGNYTFVDVTVGSHVITVVTDEKFNNFYRLLSDEDETVTVESGATHNLNFPLAEREGIRVEIEINAGE
jgi:hypothetical protein